MSHFFALACEALVRSLYASAAASPHTVTLQMVKQGLHNHPKNLRAQLQDHIDAIPPGTYDAILLVYGICGTSTVGLTARHTPLVMPRAHDCITLYLGSRTRYQEEFEQHPGTYWYSVDYMERAGQDASAPLGSANIEIEQAAYESYVEKFGQETADLLIEEMRGWLRHYTRAVFIDTGLGDGAAYERMAREQAESAGWLFERRQGNRRLLDMLTGGDWPDDEFLVVPPGYTLRQSFSDGLIRAVLAEDDSGA